MFNLPFSLTQLLVEALFVEALTLLVVGTGTIQICSSSHHLVIDPTKTLASIQASRQPHQQQQHSIKAFFRMKLTYELGFDLLPDHCQPHSQIIRALDIDYQSTAKVSGVYGVVLKRQQMLYSEWSTCQSFATSAIDYRLSIIRCQLLKRLSSRNQNHSIPSHPLLSPADTASSCNALSMELSVHQLIATLTVQFSDTLNEYDLGVDRLYRTDQTVDDFDL
ncbi:hypothetical protein T11_1014 [Trichinella zimbabwensis]|uniref:Uncharacterized protein n=1 Tax=Trichinella zimbabwensis TaxID=268475 RepID=A0A0V1HZP0_9BILA|nr:hypothetical protein T11_1014 [Trichinella zimbabwensis]